MELVKWVAKAVAPVRHTSNDYGYQRPRVMVIDERIARAAIAEVLDAMETPSHAMVTRAVENVGPVGCCLLDVASAAETWQAMLAQFKAENGI